MAKKNKIDIKFKCPKCGEFAKPNSESSKNFDVFDMVCPDCNVRYDWIYGSEKE